LQLQGLFNVSNALAAITTAQGHGISTKVCKKALEQLLVVPGRMEQIVAKPFSVVVDYALTPVALEKVYQSLKPATGKLICVVSGTGGGRDKWKRPVMGKVAATYCARVIVTNEDPYEEDPLKIIEQVASGAGARAEIIEDRRKATPSIA
jgi:UDP-N-acetylmuramoyl-L-alanyl-D-glutamate--2,6-diaminopimelate ligase